MLRPDFQAANDQEFSQKIAWGLWGASFLIVGGVFVRGGLQNWIAELPAFTGPLIVCFTMTLSCLGTWLFRKNSSRLTVPLDFAASFLNFIPGVLLTALVINPESVSQVMFVLMTFACSSLVLYLNPKSTTTTSTTSSEDLILKPEVSLLDYATQLRQAEQKDEEKEGQENSKAYLALGSLSEEQSNKKQPGNKQEQDEPDCDLFHDDSEWVTQKFKRTKSPEGAEVFEGFIKVEWAPGQRSAVVNIPFSPAFSKCPEVYCEPDDGCPSRTKVAECRPYGTRIEVRLPQECGEHNFSYVHILACLNVEEAEKQETISA